MDELEISGKRYLSSRKAAKQHKYHSDYIGQLIRAGKIVGTKVGRAWYVEADSLNAYFDKEQEAALVQSVPVENAALFRTEAPAPAAVKTSYSFSPSVANTVEVADEPQEQTNEKEYYVPIQKVGLTYIPDEQPLMPEIRPTAKVYAPARMLAQQTYTEAHTPSIVQQQRRKERRILPVLALLTLGLVVLGGVALGSVYVNSKLVVEQGQPASVGFSLK